MNLVTRIDRIKETSPQLYCSIVEVDTWIDCELSKLVAEKRNSLNPSFFLAVKSQLQERLSLLGENANRKAMIARSKGNFRRWFVWNKTVAILDWACDWLDENYPSSSYFIY